MLSKNVIYYGKDTPLPTQVELKAGPLKLIYEQGDLRTIRWGEVEIIRRITMALRDRDWGTVAPVLSGFSMAVGQDSFQITYQVENRQGEIDFAWQGSIHGEPDGAITFSMDGEARSTFWRSRIGFCLLYPAALAGKEAHVMHAQGLEEEAVFPLDIAADQPVPSFADIARVSHPVAPGILAEVSFSGDVFEMEDQRNWTDASYKIFSTPLRLPSPVEIQAGDRVSQSITLRLRQSQPVGAERITEIGAGQIGGGSVLSFQPGMQAQSLPGIGLGSASHGQPLTPKELARLRRLNLHHQRVDLYLQAPGWEDCLRRATLEARALDVGLLAALLGPENALAQLDTLRDLLDELKPPLTMLLCFPALELFKGGSPVGAAVQAVRRVLGGSVPIAAGTNTDLIFLKRSLPPMEQIQALTFAICPQVHAFDNTSLVETLETQRDVVRSARRLDPRLPVMVSLVTLKMRFNSYATGTSAPINPGELPPQVDVRQMALFGAAWTLGSFSYLAQGGANAVTYYETSGWRGVMEVESGSSLPEVFQSQAGCVFPLYHVLADLGEFRGGQFRPLQSNQPLKALGIQLLKEDKECLVVANLTPLAQSIALDGLAGDYSVRVLDETSFNLSVQAPDDFRRQGGSALHPQDGRLDLKLLPYAVARLDR